MFASGGEVLAPTSLPLARGGAVPPASEATAGVGQLAGADIVWLVLSLALPLLLIWLLWRWLPKYVQVALLWLDDQIPGDYSALHRPFSTVIVLAISIAILIPASISLLWSLGVDIAQVRQLFADFGLQVGRWAANQGLKILLVLFFAFLAQRFVSHAIPRAIEGFIRSRSEQEKEAEVQKRITTLSAVVTRAVSLVVILGALFMVLAQLGVNLAPLLAAAGVVGIAIGFGAQNLIRDIFAGLFVVLENQYRIGDVVTLAGVSGIVEDINLRRTVLRDLEYKQHFIPNGEIRIATNFTKDKSRVSLNIGVAYKEDLEQVMKVLNDIGIEMTGDPYWGPLILDAPKALRVNNFGESAIEIMVLGETVPIRQWEVAGEYRLRVKKAFDRLGIEIPFPHRTIYFGSGEPNLSQLGKLKEERQPSVRTSSDIASSPPASMQAPQQSESAKDQ